MNNLILKCDHGCDAILHLKADVEQFSSQREFDDALAKAAEVGWTWPAGTQPGDKCFCPAHKSQPWTLSPTIEGWWWVQMPGSKPEVVNVSIINGEHLILTVGCDQIYSMSEFRGALWSGPLTPGRT